MKHPLESVHGKQVALEPREVVVPRADAFDEAAIAERWLSLAVPESGRVQLLDPQTASQAAAYARNIENFIGTVKVPVGLAGPLRVAGRHACGDYHVPLATTEAALVASYNRGAKVVTAAGGARTLLLDQGVCRAPVLQFTDLDQVERFLCWLDGEQQALARVADATTRYGRLKRVTPIVEGNRVFLRVEFTSADASGQNMVTLAADRMLAWIVEHTPVTPTETFIEGNCSGDKKASAWALQAVRGHRVTAEATLPAVLVRERLHAEPAAIVASYRACLMGAVLSGTIGAQGHFANGLAALFIACGQDAACVAEAAVGTTRLETTVGGDLYAAVMLPNLIVGTVGGGTGLPSQRVGLELLGLAGPDGAAALAEVAAALCLAGEISILAAIAAGDFSRAHIRFARGVEVTS